jgi:hypothetical protein
MDMIRLAIQVTVAAAVREGTGRAGRETVTLSPEVLASIPETEREILASLLTEQTDAANAHRPTGVMEINRSPLRLPSTDTSPDAVVAALRAVVAAEVKRREDARAEERARLARVVERVMGASIAEIAPGAVPWERWRVMADGGFLADVTRDLDAAEAVGIEGAGAARVRRMALLEEVQTLATESTHKTAQAWCALPLSKRVHRTAKTGWEVVRPVTGSERFATSTADEHYGAACPEYALALAEARAEVKRLDADEARAEEEREVRAETLRGLWREWALTRPELAPAAQEGYDVIGGCADDVMAQAVALAGAVPGVTRVATFQGGTKAWKEWTTSDRKAPKPAAIAAQKTLAVGVGAITVPEGMVVECERVQRVTIDVRDEWGNGDKTHHTALVVQITSPLTAARAVVAFLE